MCFDLIVSQRWPHFLNTITVHWQCIAIVRSMLALAVSTTNGVKISVMIRWRVGHTLLSDKVTVFVSLFEPRVLSEDSEAFVWETVCIGCIGRSHPGLQNTSELFCMCFAFHSWVVESSQKTWPTCGFLSTATILFFMMAWVLLQCISVTLC